MFDFIYAEDSILDHPRTRALPDRFPVPNKSPATATAALWAPTGLPALAGIPFDRPCLA